MILPGQVRWDFREIDTHAKSYKPTVADLSVLAQDLTSPCKGDLESVRAIFQFVSHYLEYDGRPVSVSNRISRSGFDLATKRKGVCWDYAELVRKLCEEMNIACLTIVGWARNPMSNTNAVDGEPNHAWNLIGLEDDYFLLDATWAAALNNTGEREKYFLSRPEHLIETHLPACPFFQLLDCPLTGRDYLDHKNAYWQDTCNFAFKDSVDQFIKLDYYDQKIIVLRNAHLVGQNRKTAKGYAHAIIDKAVFLKDSADILWEQQGNLLVAESMYQQSIDFFEQASPEIEYYPWQIEARALAYLNFAQIYYTNHYSQKGFNRQIVVASMTTARELLTSLETESVQHTLVLRQIDRYLKLLEN